MSSDPYATLRRMANQVDSEREYPNALNELREQYEQRSRYFERTAEGDPLHALHCAIYICWRREWPVPGWLYVALTEVLDAQRKKRPARGKRSAHERYRQALTDFLRYTTVRGLMDQGTDSDEVWEAAAQELQNTEHRGEAATIRDSYYRVHQSQ